MRRGTTTGAVHILDATRIAVSRRPFGWFGLPEGRRLVSSPHAPAGMPVGRPAGASADRTPRSAADRCRSERSTSPR